MPTLDNPARVNQVLLRGGTISARLRRLSLIGIWLRNLQISPYVVQLELGLEDRAVVFVGSFQNYSTSQLKGICDRVFEPP